MGGDDDGDADGSTSNAQVELVPGPAKSHAVFAAASLLISPFPLLGSLCMRYEAESHLRTKEELGSSTERVHV